MRLPSPAACIKERSPVLKGRAPPHRPRGRASTEIYSSKLAPTNAILEAQSQHFRHADTNLANPRTSA
eukprot:1149082-Pelagomonas_calceolata.AAC.2